MRAVLFQADWPDGMQVLLVHMDISMKTPATILKTKMKMLMKNWAHIPLGCNPQLGGKIPSVAALLHWKKQPWFSLHLVLLPGIVRCFVTSCQKLSRSLSRLSQEDSAFLSPSHAQLSLYQVSISLLVSSWLLKLYQTLQTLWKLERFISSHHLVIFLTWMGNIQTSLLAQFW